MMSTMRKKVIIAAAAGVLALAAGLVLLLARGAAQYAVVYEKGSRNLFVATPKGSFALHGGASERQVFAGRYLYYDIEKDGLFEIYAMDLRSSRSRKEGGSLLAQGVRRAWMVSPDGRYAAWIEAKGSVLRRYDAKSKGVTELASGVDELYAAGDVLFFAKGQGEFFRCNLQRSQTPERMASDVRDVNYFDSIVYYLLPAGEDFDLYSLAGEGGASLVAQAPEKLLFDSYEPGGNLYFLKKGEGSPGALTIDDPHAESDAAMKQPQKPPGSGILSGILPDVLGLQAAYRRDKAVWDKKVERDKVRAALADALEELPESEAPMDCWVFDGEGARLLARGVREGGIAALRAWGRPAMLYEKRRGSESDHGVVIQLDSLAAAYKNGGASALREALYTLAGAEGESMGYALATMTPTGPAELPLGPDFGGSAGWMTAFLPGGETMLYWKRDVEGGLYFLYAYEMTDYGLSERRVIDLGVHDVTVLSDEVYYRKKNADADGTALYFYAPDGDAGRAMRSAEAFFPAGEGLLAFDGDTLYSVRGAQARRLGGGVHLEGVRASASYACYLTDWEAGAGTLRLFNLSRKKNSAAAKALDTGVTAIRIVRD